MKGLNTLLGSMVVYDSNELLLTCNLSGKEEFIENEFSPELLTP